MKALVSIQYLIKEKKWIVHYIDNSKIDKIEARDLEAAIDAVKSLGMDFTSFNNSSGSGVPFATSVSANENFIQLDFNDGIIDYAGLVE